MIWRGIVILFTHFTVAMLALSGFHWLEQGIGLNPLIAFPSAILLFCWIWLWVLYEANEANCKLENYLEYLDRREKTLDYFAEAGLEDHYIQQIEGSRNEIHKAREILM